MNNQTLSPLAMASLNLVNQNASPNDANIIEAGCRDLLTYNTNGLGSEDTRTVDVATEILRGVLSAFAQHRAPLIAAATRGVCQTGPRGEAGDADRLSISIQMCRDVRSLDQASQTDFDSALDGAAAAARMTAHQLRVHINAIPLEQDHHSRPKTTHVAGSS